MCFQQLHVLLPYEPLDFERLVEYLESHQVPEGGRYQLGYVFEDDMEPIPDLFSVAVFTHPWSLPSLKAEAAVMCGYRFDTSQSALTWIAGAPSFDLETAWRELAALEEKSLGAVVHEPPKSA